MQLSRTGQHPYEFMGEPAITVDSNGHIHAFWVSSYSEDGINNRYSQIEYRSSINGGMSWSVTENLTPEYTTERIYYMKAVCDSKNHVHLIYMRGNETLEVLYKKYDGIAWSEPELIGYGTSYLRMNIDSDDRIYVTWMIGREAYFAYRDSSIWSDYAQIGTGEYGISDIKFDNENYLYSIGTCYTDVTPYLFNYNKSTEDWDQIKELPNDTLTLGRVVSISNDNETLFINNSYRTYENSTDFHLNMDLNTGNYSNPYQYGERNNPDREMYIDKHGYLHLFEEHYFTQDTMDDSGMIHSTGKNGIWETVVIDSVNEDFSYSYPAVAFDRVNNKFYLLYKKYDRINLVSRIYFHLKQNTTDIEENDELLIDDFKLFQNYPNPFNNQTQISYSIARKCHIELSVFNVNGQIISNIVNSKQNRGKYSISFNANELNNGIYYYQLKIDNKIKSVKRMLYLK